jgi:hypothetical protein
MIAGTVNAGLRMMLELSLVSPEAQEVIEATQDRLPLIGHSPSDNLDV